MWDKLVQFWEKLTEPNDSVHGHETRQKARFMTTLYVIMLPLGSVMLLWGLATAYPGNIITDNDFIVMLPAGFIWLAAYVLSKRGHFELAALISIGVAFIGIFLSNVLDAKPAVAEISFLLFPILLSSLMLDHRITAILVGIALMLAGVFPFINPQISFYDVLAGPITFLLIGSAMILISNYHRDRLERVRREQEREYQDRSRKLLASSYQGMCIVDGDTIIEASYGCAALLGYPVEELIGLKIEELAPTEMRDPRIRNLRDLLKISNEVAIRRKDGSRIYVELLPQQEESEGRSVDVVAVRDITNRKQAQLALQREKEKAQTYLQVAEVVMLALDRQGCISLVNKKGCEILGFEEEEIVGKNWVENFLPVHTRKQVGDNFKQIMAGEIKPLEYYENPIITRQGEERIIAWHNSLLRDEEGNITGTLSSGEDISERHRAERKLAKSEARYRAVVEDQVDLINRCTLDGTFTFVNEAYASFHGMRPQDLVGKNYQDLFDEDTLNEILDSLMSLNVDQPIRYDPPIQVIRDGEETWLQWSSKLILDEAGEPIEYQSIGRDITQLKLAEKSMRKGEARYRAVVEDQVDLINRYNLDGTITFVNEAYANFFGIDPIDIIGKTHAAFLPIIGIDNLNTLRHRLTFDAPVLADEVKHEFPDGKVIWIHWTDRLIFDDEGRPIEFQGVGTDVTDLKLVQEALSKTEQDYRGIFEGAHDAIVIITPDDETILDANQRACDMYGFSREEIIGKSMELVTKDVPRGKAYLADILEKGKLYQFESVHIDIFGNEINIEVNASIIDYQGQMAILGIVRDVTEKVRSQEKLEFQAAELSRANALTNALSKVAAQISVRVDPESVLETLGDELRQFGIDSAVTLMRPDEDLATIEYVSINSKMVKQIERLTDKSFRGFEMPGSTWAPLPSKALAENRPQFAPSFSDAILPGFEELVSISVFKRGLELVGLGPHIPGIFLPFRADEKTTGILTIWGADLREEDIPTFSIFTSQLAAAYENARLYAAEQRQARELERSNELVKALSLVSTQVVATEEPEQIFVTLGRELRSIGMTCGFISINEPREIAKIEYLSSDSKALQAVGKLGNISLIGYEIPEAQQAFREAQPVFSNDYARSLAHMFSHYGDALVAQGLKLVSKSADTRGVYLPLYINDDVVGLLNISGENLRETDLPAFRVFSSQVSSVLAKARLHQAERRQAAEVERSNALVKALSRVAAGVSATNDPDDILENLGKELQALGLEYLLSLLKPDRQSFYISYVSYNTKLIKQLEKITGLRVSEFELYREKWPEGTLRLYEHNEPEFLASFVDTITPFFPRAPQKLIKRGLRVVGMTDETAAVYLPMYVDSQVIGSLTIVGETLREDDLTAFSVFASQLASVYESARLYEAEQKQAVELERSNSLITVLNNVGAKIAATTDPDEVLETLGTELKELDFNCVVMTLSPDRQDTIIHYLSVAAPIVEKAEKLAGLSAIGLKVNRSTWAPEIISLYDDGQPVFVPDFLVSTLDVVDFIPRKILEQGMRMVGMGSSTNAIYVPLTMENTVFGGLCVWGSELHQTDLPAFTVFANQVGSVFENARLYEAERQQATELARSNKLVDALSRISARIAETNEPDAVFEILGEELKYFQVGCTISFIEADYQATRLVFSSISSKLISKIEDLTGTQLNNRRMPRDTWTEQYEYLIDTGQPFCVKDYSQALVSYFPDIGKSIFTNALSFTGINDDTSAIVLPLDVSGELFGTISVWGQDLREEDIHSFSVFSRQVAGVFENARLYAAEQRQIKRLNALRTIDQAISSSHDEHAVFETVLEQVTTQLEVDAAAILLLRPSTNALEFVAGRGLRSDVIETTPVPMANSHLGHTGFDRRLIQFPDIRVSPNSFRDNNRMEAEGVQAYFAAPLMVDRSVKGVLEVYHRQPFRPDEEWLDFLETLAGQAAIALDNTQLFDSLQQSNTSLLQAYNATLEGWAKALELRDSETEGHSQRVTGMVVRLSRNLGLSEDAIVEVRRGALLHDIGKMGIPDSILRKPGPLDEDEWEIMRRHPVHAFELLSRIPYLSAALDIPYCHHEKWNGTGYPRGLESEQIPLAARIFAVVDVYDALTSDRPYRKAWLHDEALAYIAEESGQHFDPVVVDAFLQMLEDHPSKEASVPIKYLPTS